ncbi:MAG: gamma-glutamylcyclotransferase family protein [Qingshengfaniella sp.]
MQERHFFGYGSLVNRRTHDYHRTLAATLPGWRREWRSTRLRDIAILSARPVPGGSIAGLIAEVPGDDWTALDQREADYLRHDISATIQPAVPGPRHTQVYQVDPGIVRSPCDGAILLSYLDTVIQGFLDMGGAAAAAGFFATTDGWARDVLDDRAAPIYPRATSLTAQERGIVDTALAALPVRIRRP